MYHLEAWAMGPVHKKQRAVKVTVMLDEPPSERDVMAAKADATACWRRWFILGKRAEEINDETGMPDRLVYPEVLGHKVVER